MSSSQYASPVSPNNAHHGHAPQNPHPHTGSQGTLVAGTTPKPPAKSSRIGPYIMTKTLGMGSTGRVKLGVHQRTNQKVAVKIIPKQAMTNGQQQNLARKIEREIVIMKLVQHPHVMQLYDVYETDDELYLVLEHVEGGELFDYLVKRGRLDEKEACTFFQQIIFGLDYCHKHQICHRDLKPENLLLDSHRRIKIADFGMASLQQAGKMLETSCGSPHYASPEIIRGVKYDGALSDIWSCGVILYALLSGNLPFDDENIRRLLSKVKAGKFYMPPHISSLAQDLITKMLNVDPEARIQMQAIIAHPWFHTVPVNAASVVPVAQGIAQHSPVCGDDVDDDIVKSLNLLGWNDEHGLRASLASPDQTPEKVYYHLLRARKEEYLQNYMADGGLEEDMMGDGDNDTDSGLPRRRAESLASVFTERAKRGKSEASLVSGSQASLLGESPKEGKESSSNVQAAAAATAGKDGRPLTPRQQSLAQMMMTRPGSTHGAPADEFRGRVQSSVDTLTDPRRAAHHHNHREFHHHPSSATHHPHGATASHSNLTSSSNNSNAVHPLTVQIPSAPKPTASSAASAGSSPSVTSSVPALNSGSGGTGGSDTSPHGSSPGTPRFHRAPIRPLAGAITPLTSSPTNQMAHASQSDLSASTPTLTVPKRSWFAALMANFKPESMTLVHPANPTVTLALLKRVLPELGVKVQDGRRSGLKCKAEVPVPASATGASGAYAAAEIAGHLPAASELRVVKFRIDIADAAGGSNEMGSQTALASPSAGAQATSSGSSVLSCSLQQGPMAGMQRVIAMLSAAGIGQAGIIASPVQAGHAHGNSGGARVGAGSWAGVGGSTSALSHQHDGGHPM
ncbi:kinase-like domain-containing protein [Catenaria anguillulae PL171]|uniref:non-specific serine/threonine protein kinase n=1 Tax=Catenaria anguillulae PL171 TaxID=765915 RepID=A0A1Y2H803_9FUNG|nr:kinase-like domain-containing protein [Catenaria anguillulae PL171]